MKPGQTDNKNIFIFIDFFSTIRHHVNDGQATIFKNITLFAKYKCKPHLYMLICTEEILKNVTVNNIKLIRLFLLTILTLYVLLHVALLFKKWLKCD